MKKKTLLILATALLMTFLSGCRYDTPADMLRIFNGHLKETGNVLDALGRYSADYGWKYFVDEDSIKDVSWDSASNYDNPLKCCPRLVSRIDMLEYYNNPKVTVIHLKDSDYIQTINEIDRALDNAGFEQNSNRNREERVSQEYSKDTAGGILTVDISAYEQVYSESHNITIDLWLR